MKSKNIYIYAILLTIFLTLYGCYKDQGNYNYRDINELEIYIGQYFFEVPIGTRVTIEPVIIPSIVNAATQNPDNYTYRWTAYTRTLGAGTVFRMATIGLSRNLDTIIRLPEGHYEVLYEVTDKETGVTFAKTFEMFVKNEFSTGWLLLTDVGGQMHLDMLPLNNGRYTYYSNILNLPEPENRLPESERTGPIKMLRFRCNLSPDRIAFYLLAQSGTNRIRSNSTFTFQDNWNIRNNFLSMSFTNPGFVATNMTTMQANYTILMSGRSTVRETIGGSTVERETNCLFYYNVVDQVFWSLPDNTINGGRTYFNASSKFAGTGEYGVGFIVFDDDSKSFYRIGGQIPGARSIVPPTGTMLLPYERTGMDLVDMLYNANSPGSATKYIYAIMQHPTTKAFRILRAYHQNMLQTHWQEMSTTVYGGGTIDWTQAKLFTVGGSQTGNIYYTVDGKVYAYNLADNQSFLMLDEGYSEITYLGFRGTAEDIFVGSFTGGKGTLERYTVNVSRFVPFEIATHIVGNEDVEFRFGPNTTPQANFGRIIDLLWQ